MDKTINIHIGGPRYGLHNIGDEAILLSILKSFSNYSLSVSTYDSKWIDLYFNDVKRKIINIEYSEPKLGLFIDPKKFVIRNSILLMNEIKFYGNKNIYICGGGTILSDCPWYSLRTVQIAGLSGVPTFLWGVGMAEVHDIKTQQYIKKVLNKEYVREIYTRDQFVMDRLLKIGVNPEKVSVSYDPAILLDGKKFNYGLYFNDNQIRILNNGCINIVISLSGETDVIKKTPIDIISDSVLELQKTLKANIVLISTGWGTHCKDNCFLKELYKKLDYNHTVFAEKEFAPEHLIYFLKKTNLIISSRLHMNIFGACSGTPSIGLVRNEKNIDFSELMNLPYLFLDNLKKSDLLRVSEKIINNEQLYRNRINNKVSEMRRKYLSSVEKIKKDID